MGKKSVYLLMAFIAGLTIGTYYTSRYRFLDVKRPTIVDQPIEPSEVELIAELPEGARLYRVVNKRAIIPTFVGVAPNGNIAIR